MKMKAEPPHDTHERQRPLPLPSGGGKAGPLTLPPHITALEEARAWLLENACDGAVCPCCDRPLALQKRPLYGQMALALLLIHKHTAALAAPDYVHVPSFLVTRGLPPRLTASIRGDYSKLRYFGLLESRRAETGETRRDGNPRLGLWRVTEAGTLFCLNRLRVPKYVYLLNGRPVAGLATTETVNVVEALGDRFDYASVTRPTWTPAELASAERRGGGRAPAGTRLAAA